MNVYFDGRLLTLLTLFKLFTLFTLLTLLKLLTQLLSLNALMPWYLYIALWDFRRVVDGMSYTP